MNSIPKGGAVFAMVVAATVSGALGTGSAAAQDSTQLCSDGQPGPMSNLVYNSQSETMVRKVSGATRGIPVQAAATIEPSSAEPYGLNAFGEADESLAGSVQWGKAARLGGEIGS